MKIKVEVGGKRNLTHSSTLALKALSDFFHYSNFPVALCTSAASLGAFYLSNAKINFSCLLFIFCATAFIYNLDRINPSEADLINAPDRCKWIKENSFLLKRFNIIHFITCLSLLAYHMQIKTFLTALILLALCMIYKGRVQKVAVMKNIIVAAVWTITVSLLPCIWQNNYINLDFVIFCFCIALVNTIIFDQRDSQGDQLAGIKSIPIICTERSCTQIVYLLSILTCIYCLSLDLPLLLLIPFSYISIYNWKSSKLKYLTADLVLALPALLYIL